MNVDDHNKSDSLLEFQRNTFHVKVRLGRIYTHVKIIILWIMYISNVIAL